MNFLKVDINSRLTPLMTGMVMSVLVMLIVHQSIQAQDNQPQNVVSQHQVYLPLINNIATPSEVQSSSVENYAHVCNNSTLNVKIVAESGPPITLLSGDCSEGNQDIDGIWAYCNDGEIGCHNHKRVFKLPGNASPLPPAEYTIDNSGERMILLIRGGPNLPPYPIGDTYGWQTSVPEAWSTPSNDLDYGAYANEGLYIFCVGCTRNFDSAWPAPPPTSTPTPDATSTPAPVPTNTPIPTPLPSDGIQIVNISRHEVSPGEGFNPSITIKVTSGQLDISDYLHAHPEDSSNTFGAHPLQGVHHVVTAGNTYTFQADTHEVFRMTAPQQTGSYQSVWRMHINGQDAGPEIIIPIIVRNVSDPHPIDYWDAYYYTSKDLSGSVSHHTTLPDLYLFKDWGIGSPNSAIPVDNWSAKFVREINFPGGEYRFHCQHDDGCRILIDGNTKLDAWWDSSFDGHDWTGTLTPGLHEVKVQYYDQGGDARLDVWWQGPGFLPLNPSCEPDQWCGEYWGNKTLSGYPPLMRPEGTGMLDVGWGMGSPGYHLPSDNFSARFTRTMSFACGTYRFHVTADDGDRFYIDGALKLDEWTYKGQYTTDVDVQLTEGDHTLRVDYYEDAGDTAMRLIWDQLTSCAPTAGDLVVSSGQTVQAATTQTQVTASGTTASVSTSDGFAAGDQVLFHQTQGTANAGQWEMAQIVAINGNSWTLGHALTHTYDSNNGRAQAIKVPRYTSVTVQSGGTLTALPWNGATGGILVFESDGNVTIDGALEMTGKGFRGGLGGKRSLNRTGVQGESYTGPGVTCSSQGCNVKANNAGGGGSGGIFAIGSGGGAGAGYGTVGTQAPTGNAVPGTTYGPALADTIFLGSGGGGGYEDGGGATGGNGGNGGGLIIVNASNITVNGHIVADGATGQGTPSYAGGGGSGGSIYLHASSSLTIGTDKVLARGGAAGVTSSGWPGGNGGAGGVGRVWIEYCNVLAGSTNPAANLQQQNCTAPTATPAPTAASTSTPVSTAPPTMVPTPTATPAPTDSQGVELLSESWHLEGDNGAAELYEEIPADVLQGKDMLRITYDLHGLNALSGDASAIIFDQGDWRFISLSNYGQNGKDGQQVVEIPLSDFPGLNPNASVGTLHTRFWYGGPFVVDITSIVAYSSGESTPVPTVTPTTMPTPIATPSPAPTDSQGVELLSESWHLEGDNGAAELYEEIPADVLQGKDMLRITYDLHGLQALGGDASAIIFDQNGWQYISLSNYGQNGLDGVQTVDIPLADFSGLNPNADVGTLHTRFWYGGPFVVDITSIVAYSGVTAAQADSPAYEIYLPLLSR